MDTDERFQLCYTQLHCTALPLLQLEQQNLWIWTWSMGCGRNDSIESIVYKHYDCYLDKCKTVFQVQRLCIWELINHDGQLSKLVYKIQYSEGLLWNWTAIILVYCKYHFQASTDLDNEMTICERISIIYLLSNNLLCEIPLMFQVTWMFNISQCLIQKKCLSKSIKYSSRKTICKNSRHATFLC